MMQLQDTDWQMSMATNRIGEPSSWTPVAVRFGADEPEYGLLYYSPLGCYFVPDTATMESPIGIQSLIWGPGLIPTMGDEAGEHALVEMAGGQLSISADHAEALVRLASEGSAIAAAPIVPTQAVAPHQQPAPGPVPVQPGPAQAAPAQPVPGVYPTTGVVAQVGQDPSVPAEVSEGGGHKVRFLIYGLIALVVIVAGYFAVTTFLLT